MLLTNMICIVANLPKCCLPHLVKTNIEWGTLCMLYVQPNFSKKTFGSACAESFAKIRPSDILAPALQPRPSTPSSAPPAPLPVPSLPAACVVGLALGPGLLPAGELGVLPGALGAPM